MASSRGVQGDVVDGEKGSFSSGQKMEGGGGFCPGEGGVERKPRCGGWWAAGPPPTSFPPWKPPPSCFLGGRWRRKHNIGI